MQHLAIRCAIVALLSLSHFASAQDESLPTIYIAGDSTAANGSEGARGWGRHLPTFFDPSQVNVENRARGGRSSRTFVTEGLWENIHAQLQPGDVVLIQFGHNDGGRINAPQRARGSIRGLGDETEEIDNQQTGKHEIVHTFGWYMRKMIAETREKDAIPILMSLTVRNRWDEGNVERGSGRYSQWTRELAESENTAFIDLTNIAADHYQTMGEEKVAKLFPRDHTHTSDEGALLNARLALQGFKALREEMWRPWLSAGGRAEPRAEPKYVLFPRVDRRADEARFINTPFPADLSLPTLWLIGDSTVRTGRGRGEGDQFGWGDPIENAFDATKINVVNRAMGGTGARTFRSGGLWQPVLEMLKPGDVVLIQFGHNDNGARGALRGTSEETETRSRDNGSEETVRSFGAYLRLFLDEIRAKDATPIICSLIPRNIWRDEKIQRAEDGHAAWAKQIAEEMDALFIDLHERIALRYDPMGQEAVTPLFADQRVHTTYAGAALNAQCVLEGLDDLPENPLASFLLHRDSHENDSTAGVR